VARTNDVGCLIIDDVDRALSRASVAGRELLVASAAAVRHAVLEFAERRRWSVVPYDRYEAWACQLAAASGLAWVALDPLFAADESGTQITKRRYSRAALFRDGLSTGPVRREVLPLGSPVGLIDDAASSGFTLSYASGDIVAEGSRVTHVAVCASSRGARERIKANLRVRWSEYVPGDWRVIHLRDGCPYLPFSGRPVAPRSSVGNGNVVSLSPTAVVGSLWQVLWLDCGIRDAITQGRQAVVRGFNELAGREATMQDLAMLGEEIPALVNEGREVGSLTTLASALSASIA